MIQLNGYQSINYTIELYTNDIHCVHKEKQVVSIILKSPKNFLFKDLVQQRCFRHMKFLFTALGQVSAMSSTPASPNAHYSDPMLSLFDSSLEWHHVLKQVKTVCQKLII